MATSGKLGQWGALQAEDEKSLARRMVQAEERARSLIAAVPCAAGILGKRTRRAERTRAAHVDRIGRALEAVWEASEGDPELRRVAREARAAWADAEQCRWDLAMSGRRIAHGEARKLAGPFMDIDDLAQEGYVGLLRAAKRFDPERDIRFSTYARWWVRAQMTRAIDHTGRPVRLPGCAVEQTRNLRKAIRMFETAGVEYTYADLAKEVGIEPERAEFLLSRGRTVSLDDPVDDGPKARPVAHFLADEDAVDAVEDVIQRQEIGRMLEAVERVLSERHRFVLVRRYGLEDDQFRTLSEIARGMNLSRERVRQIEREALSCLRQLGGIRVAA